MAMFIAHIAFILQVMAIAAGLVALHYARQLNAGLIKGAGTLLIIFGITGILCTGYYAAKYYLHGHYEHAYASGMPMGMMMEGDMMSKDGKQCCPMCAKMMQSGMKDMKPVDAAKSEAPKAADDADHKAHHPQ